MKRLNAIIDFNNMAFRAMHVCPYMGEGDIVNFDTQDECNILARKIVTDISYLLRLFTPDRVIIACDSKELWRKTLYDSIEGEEYKGTRKKDDTKNWTKIFETLSDIKEVLKRQGVVITELDHTEADDIAAMWKDELFRKNNEDILLVTSDRDWSQLVEFDTQNDKFCVMFNPIANNKGQKKIYITTPFTAWVESPDVTDIFFTNNDNIKKIFKNIFAKDPKIEYEQIDPDRVVLEKIMCGDDGDNVPAFYNYYKNGKKVRITPLKASHIFESLNIRNISDMISVSSTDALKNEIEKELKHEIDVDTTERLLRQRKLVELNKDLFPDNVRTLFNQHMLNVSESGYIQTADIRMENVLKDTKYLSKDYNKPKNNSIFSNIVDVDKYLGYKPTNIF